MLGQILGQNVPAKKACIVGYSRSIGSRAMCVSGSSEAARDRCGPLATMIDPVSANPASAPVTPTRMPSRFCHV